MAKVKQLVPANTAVFNKTLPSVDVTQEMRDDVEALKNRYKIELGQTVSMADVVRWAVQAFIDAKKGR